MPYEKPYIKITLSGSLADGNEIFSTGFSIGDNNQARTPEAAFALVAENLEDIVAPWVNNWDAGALKIPYDAFLLQAKASLRYEDGKERETESVEIELEQFGTWNGPYSPQDARVVTLDSGKRKDPGKYNRMYLPSGGNTEANAYQMTLAEQTAYAGVIVDIIQGVQDALELIDNTGGLVWSVVSNAGQGHQRLVQAVRIGALVDTQRRRRNKLPENYVTVNLI